MRLIDGDALKEKLPNTYRNGFENCRECRLLEREEVNAYIDGMPTVDAAPVVHGRWMNIANSNCDDLFRCSVCKETWLGIGGYKYCPNCGAKMDLEEQDAQTEQSGK